MPQNNKEMGVMLSLSKHGGQGLHPHILRQAQDDRALKLSGLLVMLLCFLFCVPAWSQGKDTLSKDTSGKKPEAISNPKALIVIDGIIYNGDIKDLDPNEISSVTILKSSGATKIYGPAGASGAILIEMKRPKPFDSSVGKDALFVVDGVPSNNKLNGVDPKDILSINILKKGKNSDPSLEAQTDVVIVVTKQGAIKSYQKKFAAFSTNYRRYLEAHQSNDEDFLYVVDGVPVQGKRNGIIETLYKIPPEKIRKVGFNAKEQTHGSKTLVIINTKQ